MGRTRGWGSHRASELEDVPKNKKNLEGIFFPTCIKQYILNNELILNLIYILKIEILILHLANIF